MTEKELRQEWLRMGRLELQSASATDWERYQELTRKVIADMNDNLLECPHCGRVDRWSTSYDTIVELSNSIDVYHCLECDNITKVKVRRAVPIDMTVSLKPGDTVV